MTVESEIVKLWQTVKSLRTERPALIDWIAFTPVVTQLGNVTIGAGSYGYYHVAASRVEVEIYIEITGTGTTNNAIVVSGWPSALNAAGQGRLVYGSGRVYDASSTVYIGAAVANGASGLSIEVTGAGGNWQVVGQLPNIALANGAQIAIRASWRI